MKTTIATIVTSLCFAATASAAPFTLTSKDFKDGGTIPEASVLALMGCTGKNTSPDLSWTGAPAGTKSFALMVHDPDAPTGGAGFWHWIVYNIPADATSIPQGAGTADGKSLPKGATQGNTDMGSPGYAGPCPPPGAPHHYNYTLYALKVDKLDVPANATASFVGFNVNGAVLGKAKLTGMYARKK